MTRRPCDDQIFLLETIPGIQYRSRQEEQDSTSAKLYFRNVIEARESKFEPAATLRKILGQGVPLAPFINFLHVIPADELTITSDLPIGQGANGEVYAAVWKKSQGALTTTAYEAKEVQVVLKRVRPTKDKDDLQKLMHEVGLTPHERESSLTSSPQLDIIYHGLAGKTVACVQFFGLIHFPDGLSSIKPSGKLGSSMLMLVFERAESGNILDEIQSFSAGAAFIESWTVTLGHMTSIAAGIETLHSHKILHR